MVPAAPSSFLRRSVSPLNSAAYRSDGRSSSFVRAQHQPVQVGRCFTAELAHVQAGRKQICFQTDKQLVSIGHINDPERCETCGEFGVTQIFLLCLEVFVQLEGAAVPEPGGGRESISS